jgi:hypothetical protein
MPSKVTAAFLLGLAASLKATAAVPAVCDCNATDLNELDACVRGAEGSQVVVTICIEGIINMASIDANTVKPRQVIVKDAHIEFRGISVKPATNSNLETETPLGMTTESDSQTARWRTLKEQAPTLDGFDGQGKTGILTVDEDATVSFEGLRFQNAIQWQIVEEDSIQFCTSTAINGCVGAIRNYGRIDLFRDCHFRDNRINIAYVPPPLLSPLP